MNGPSLAWIIHCQTTTKDEPSGPKAMGLYLGRCGPPRSITASAGLSGKAETGTHDVTPMSRKLKDSDKDSDNGKFWKGLKGSKDVQPLEYIGGAEGSRTHGL
jgi:hypothetical protein